MGPKGMSLNVSLRDINIAMPRTLADMNTFKQNSLYLIKASYSTLCLSVDIATIHRRSGLTVSALLIIPSSLNITHMHVRIHVHSPSI